MKKRDELSKNRRELLIIYSDRCCIETQSSLTFFVLITQTKKLNIFVQKESIDWLVFFVGVVGLGSQEDSVSILSLSKRLMRERNHYRGVWSREVKESRDIIQ